MFHEPNWLKIVKLLLKICFLSFKVRYLAFRTFKLHRKIDDLLREQRGLRLQQITSLLRP